MKLSTLISVHRDDLQYSEGRVTLKLGSLELDKINSLVKYHQQRAGGKEALITIREAQAHEHLHLWNIHKSKKYQTLVVEMEFNEDD